MKFGLFYEICVPRPWDPGKEAQIVRGVVELVKLTEEYGFEVKYWSMPRRRVQPNPLQKPHPPIWMAGTNPESHRLIGQMGLGLLSFSVGAPPEDLKNRIDIYREGIAECTEPIGKFVNNQAAAFTMVHCAESNEEAIEDARESCEYYPVHAGQLISTTAAWDTEARIWLDEAPPMDVYGECLIRTATTNGIIMLTFTPLLGMSEVVLQFMSVEFRPDAA